MSVSRRSVFSGRLIKVFKTVKKLPDGREAYFEEVKHPGAVLVVPFIGQKIVFIRQYRGVIGEYIWELPAGKLEKGETPHSCAKREVAEETGYEIKGLNRTGVIYTTPGFSDEKIYIYEGRCVGPKKAQLDDDEIIRTRILTRTEAKKLFDSGKIKDSKTIAGLAFSGII